MKNKSKFVSRKQSQQRDKINIKGSSQESSINEKKIVDAKTKAAGVGVHSADFQSTVDA